jgi:hypothetical protein
MTPPPGRGQEKDTGQDPAAGTATSTHRPAAQGMTPARDRDSSGRPRNARPRDELGRPLSRGVPGDPRSAGEPRPARDPLPPGELAPPGEPAPSGGTAPPGEVALPPAGALALAQRLIDRGQAFRAHEVLEASWKAAEPAERGLWKGLAQVAVGLTHAQRGNARGAVALLRRGAAAVGGYAGGCPHGIDAAGVASSAGGLADRIERDGLAAVPPGQLLVRLSTAAP